MQQSFRFDELLPTERVVIEKLLGRSLQIDETVELSTRSAAVVAHNDRQAKVVQRLLTLAEGKTLGGLSARDLIDEGRRL